MTFSSRAPTIRDVAKAAGVSIGTASKALNSSGSLRSETVNKVREAAEAVGYRPNDLAQSLHRSRSMTVGILTNDSFGRFSYPIVEAMEDRLAQEGIAVFMCNATDDPERERRHLDQLLGKRIDGLVVTARRADKRPPIDMPARRLPVVYVFSQADDPDALSLVPDDKGGAMLAVRHLAERGCRRIAHITGPEHFEAVRLRRSGYEAALAEAGHSVRKRDYLSGPWSEAWGRQAVDILFDRSSVPDGLFCGNDQIARGVAERLRERGVSVPEDACIVGFDNWNVMVEACRPPLSSVDMNLHELGRTAAESLLSSIRGEPRSGLVRLPCTLVARQSSNR